MMSSGGWNELKKKQNSKNVAIGVSESDLVGTGWEHQPPGHREWLVVGVWPLSVAGTDNDSFPHALVPMSVTFPNGDGVTRSGSTNVRG